MLITRTPFRISFFGGGTDYKEYFEEYGGSVLTATIDKYCYVTVRNLPELFPFKNQLTYSKIERFDDVDSLSHPLVRETLKYMKMDRLQINYDADLPARSGIGSSSAFAVALLQALYALKGEYPDKMALAEEAIMLERERCRESGGIQDQISVAMGGMNRLNFSADGVDVKPTAISGHTRKELNEHLMLMFTGFTHFAGEISDAQKANVKKNVSQLRELAAMVDDGEKLLKGGGDLTDFGRLLDRTWEIKQQLSDKVTNENMNAIYQRARKAGVLGGKLLGAGGGGFMLLFAQPDKHSYIKEQLSEFYFTPFAFESGGTSILYDRRSSL